MHAIARSPTMPAEFVVNHPGGESKIMLAAGKDIGPFWRVYQLHSREGGLPLELLSRMQVSKSREIETGKKRGRERV